jgi:hypothetical protein
LADHDGLKNFTAIPTWRFEFGYAFATRVDATDAGSAHIHLLAIRAEAGRLPRHRFKQIVEIDLFSRNGKARSGALF